MASGYSLLAGSSTTMTPGAFFSSSFTSAAVIFFSVSMFTDSECARSTGTRTVVAVTAMDSSPKIFLVSQTIFISSFV